MTTDPAGSSPGPPDSAWRTSMCTTSSDNRRDVAPVARRIPRLPLPHPKTRKRHSAEHPGRGARTTYADQAISSMAGCFRGTTGAHDGRLRPCRCALRGLGAAAPARLDAGRPVRHGQASARAARRAGERPPGAALVAGDVPDRCGLLLHPRLSAGHRRPGRGAAVTDRHRRPGPRDARRCAAGLPAGGRGEPARPGLDRHAGAAAVLLEGQAVRADPAGLRRHRLPHHHHPVGRRRRDPPGGEPAPHQRPAQRPDDHHPHPRRAARRGVPQGFPGGHGGGDRSRGPLPGAQRGRGGRRAVACGDRGTCRHRLVPCPDRRARQCAG